MTKETIAMRSHTYTKRIEALKLAIVNLSNFGCGAAAEEILTLDIILAEYTERLKDLGATKEYMISFEGGGWNTVYATNDEDALIAAKKEYDGEHTKVSTVYLASPAGIEAAMRSFY